MPIDIPTLRRLLGEATPGTWKLWGMAVMADVDGTSDVQMAKRVASTFFQLDGHPRTNDASLIAALRNSASELLDELERLRAEVANTQDEDRAKHYVATINDHDSAAAARVLAREFAAVRANERERCARIAEAFVGEIGHPVDAPEIASRIREGTP